MASVLTPCGICGEAVRSVGGQPVTLPVICAKSGCQAEFARQVKAVEKPEPRKAKK
jgi:hypothetical protein